MYLWAGWWGEIIYGRIAAAIILERKDKWIRRKTNKAMGKGHAGRFQQAHNRGWKISAR